MAMKVCKDCGTEVSKSAKTCPKCGKKLKHSGLRVILGIIIVIIGICSLAGDLSTTPTSTTEQGVDTASSVVSKENYDKVKKGMTEKQVKDILGEPISISENETPGLGTMILKHYQEPLTLKAIDVYFVEGKVYMKNWTDL